MGVVLAEETPPGMAAGAHLRLNRRSRRGSAPGPARALVADPGGRFGLLQPYGQPQVGDIRPGLSASPGLGPFHVGGGRSVAGLAGDVHFGPAGLVGSG